jgi:hypothetical protein
MKGMAARTPLGRCLHGISACLHMFQSNVGLSEMVLISLFFVLAFTRGILFLIVLLILNVSDLSLTSRKISSGHRLFRGRNWLERVSHE